MLFRVRNSFRARLASKHASTQVNNELAHVGGEAIVEGSSRESLSTRSQLTVGGIPKVRVAFWACFKAEFHGFSWFFMVFHRFSCPFLMVFKQNSSKTMGFSTHLSQAEVLSASARYRRVGRFFQGFSIVLSPSSTISEV